MANTEENYSLYLHNLLFTEQQRCLLKQPFVPGSLEDTNDSVTAQHRYSLRVRDNIPETTLKEALKES
jgi:hypothetical protein